MACKVCSTDPAKGNRRSLVGAAVGVNEVYATLLDSIHEACPDHPASEIHKYIGSKSPCMQRLLHRVQEVQRYKKTG